MFPSKMIYSYGQYGMLARGVIRRVVIQLTTGQSGVLTSGARRRNKLLIGRSSGLCKYELVARLFVQLV